MTSERDLTYLCFASLHSSVREKLEHYEFLNVNQLLQKTVVVQSHLKESRDVHRSHRSTYMHVVESYSNNSDDETKE
jgi:Mg2+ and Co2+ transporter CorA